MNFSKQFLLALAVTAAAAEEIKIQKSSISILNSETKPGNLLPNFLFQQGSVEGGSVGVNIGGGRGTPKPFIPDDSCDGDIFEGALEDERSPQLPYLTQDQWTCDRKEQDIDVWTMETDDLLVTVTPQYAGKVWGIYDKHRQQNLLYSNRAHQPANIATLKAWASGGAEWNWSPGIIGHSAFSETQVFLTKVETIRGDMLRVYEFDRYNGTVWQVDMIISNGTFYAHPRVTNPTKKDLRGYWWTCVAVDATPDTRIFSPAERVAETSRGQVRQAPWPYFADAQENASFTGYQGATLTDNSFLGNNQLGDMFLRISDTVYSPYIAHTQLDGYVLVHGHPLNGTKFFTWGQSGPGRFMQDFLAGGGRRQGDYTELQIGPAPTQMQTFPLPKQSHIEWTEWFRGFVGNTKVLRGKDYNAALKEIDVWMRGEDGMPKHMIKDWDHFFHTHATKAPTTILTQGQAWGYLEQLILGVDELAPGLKFVAPEPGTLSAKEAQPWIELVTTGRFSDETLSKLPLSYQTTDHWLELLQMSASKFGMTWLHALHIGTALTERGSISEPKELFEQSLMLKPNPLAARNLGILQSTPKDAWPYFQQAFALMPEWTQDVDAYDRLMLNVVTEISFFLQQQGWYDEVAAFIPQVPLAYQTSDAFITMQIKYKLQQQQFSDARSQLAANCFPTYATARIDLMSMWNTAVQGLAQQQKKDGGALTPREAHAARMNDPIPANIGCQYASEYCVNYW